MHSSTAPPPQYATGIPAQLMNTTSQWSTGLCGCCSDLPNCCLTCFCPCISFGQIAEIVDKGSTACGVHGAIYLLLRLITGCECIYSFMYRSKLRKQYMLPEEPCNDCCVHCCCECCALCQEYRELKHRGYIPSLGWHGNLAKQNQGLGMPPLGPGEMKR